MSDILPLELEGGLPEGFIPLEVISVVKCLDQDGDPATCIRQSGGLSREEMVGMLIFASDAIRADVQRSFQEGE